ncbi:MAG TPA: PucC family protein, partial [Rubrivivax sp.]
GGLMGFGLASHVLGRGADAFRMSLWGVLVGVPAFCAVIGAAPLASPMIFALGVWMIGLGGGLFAHGTLTATMNMAPGDQTGLALGAWGAVQATSAGVAVALGGVLRDGVAVAATPASAYSAVYSIEIVLLLVTAVVMAPLLRRRAAQPLPAGTASSA